MRRSALTFAVFVIAVSGCGSAGYDEDVRATYLKNCVSQGNSTDVCGCILDGLEGNLTQDEFVAINDAMFDNPELTPADEDLDTLLGILDRCGA